MFDTKKIQRITEFLQKMPTEFDDVYIVPDEIFIQEAAALFKRLRIPVRAIMDDAHAGKISFELPIISTAQASEKFNGRTALIILTKKPVSLIHTTFDFKVAGGTWTIPALVMAPDEVLAIYDRLLFLKYIEMYVEDGLKSVRSSGLPERFARGLTACSDSRFVNFKYQLFDRRTYFKPTHTFDDTAIVIQGPIAYDNDYTAETLKLYRSIYPNAPIVVSTWKGEATSSFRRVCRENSIVLLENEMPEDRGAYNVNLQLESSLQGVKFIRENTAAKFVLKTRTDQRINYFDFLVYFKNLLKTFPPKGDKLRERIIFLGSDHTRGWPFFFNDFLSFGHVEDISKLYSISRHPGVSERIKRREGRLKKILFRRFLPVDYNLVTEQSHKLRKFNRRMSRIFYAEDYIARTFYEEFIAPLDADKLLETSWKFTADYLILVEAKNIMFDWPKYEDNRYNPDYNIPNFFSFARWLDMYRNFKIDWV